MFTKLTFAACLLAAAYTASAQDRLEPLEPADDEKTTQMQNDAMKFVYKECNGLTEDECI